MREHARIVAWGLAAVAVALVVLSVHAGVSGKLPSVSGGWKLGIEILRAAVAFGVIALLLIVLVRGWGGHWPQRVSPTSIDWGDLTDAFEERKIAGDTLEEITAELAALRGMAAVQTESEGP